MLFLVLPTITMLWFFRNNDAVKSLYNSERSINESSYFKALDLISKDENNSRML
jgi:hypothetical protein